MGSEIIVAISFFGTIFGVIYLYLSTRNKERLALIEKGADASLFTKGKGRTAPVWKVIILNLALLAMGIGLGIFIASFLHYNLNVIEDVAYPGTIFFMGGLALFVGFKLTKKLEEE
jgi:hypothetical protein